MFKEPVEQEWISYPEAERYSGLSHTTLWRYVTSGKLKAARVGRSVRIHLPALREFMEAASEEAVGEWNGPPRQRPENTRRKDLMDAPFEEFYCVNETEVWVLFDVRIAGAAQQLHRERWAWQENADIKSVDEDHFVLIIRPGAAGRLAA